jgi:hypothetical protein
LLRAISEVPFRPLHTGRRGGPVGRLRSLQPSSRSPKPKILLVIPTITLGDGSCRTLRASGVDQRLPVARRVLAEPAGRGLQGEDTGPIQEVFAIEAARGDTAWISDDLYEIIRKCGLPHSESPCGCESDGP